MEAINDLRVRMSTPPPAYSPPQRCYRMRPGTTQPSAYVPRGHPRALQLGGHSEEKQLLFYKPTGIKSQPAPAYDAERQQHQHHGDDDDDACWAPPGQQHASKLEARIRALEAQLAAQAGK